MLQGLGAAKGIPDRIAVKNGVFDGVEVKAKNGRMSPYQQEFKDRLTAAGGVYVEARSLEDVMKVWREPRPAGGLPGAATARKRGGAPGRTRTFDPRLRRPVLYPTELRARPDSVPPPLRIFSVLTVLAVRPLLIMVYWLVRVRRQRRPPPLDAPPATVAAEG